MSSPSSTSSSPSSSPPVHPNEASAPSSSIGFTDFSLVRSSQSYSPALASHPNAVYSELANRNRKESLSTPIPASNPANASEIFLVPASASAFNSTATALNKFAASPAHQSQNLQHNFQAIQNNSNGGITNNEKNAAAPSSLPLSSAPAVRPASHSTVAALASASPHDSLSNLFSPLISLFKPSNTQSDSASTSPDSEAATQAQLKREWTEILHTWRPDMKASRKVHNLVWKGIPPSMREEAWKTIIANDLNITKDLYRIFQLKTEETREKEAKMRESGEYTKSDSALAIIEKDIPRTFPELKFFHEEGSPFQDSLRNILSTYSVYRPDTGYVQGMSYLAAMCLLNMDEYPAFVCLANVLNSPLHFKFFTMSVHDMNAHLEIYQFYLKSHLPTVSQHFAEINLRPDMYLFDWLMTIFTRCLPLEVAFRVWDNFLVLGHAFLFRTALAIVKTYSSQLEAEPFERCMELLLRPKNTIEEEKLFANIAKIDITTAKMDKLMMERMREQQINGSASANGILSVLQ